MKINGLIFCLLLLGASAYGQSYATQLTVAQDGSGDFNTIQAAIDATKSFPDQRITISIKDGVYTEKVLVYAWNSNLSLEGESVEGTIIRWGDSFKSIDQGRNSTFLTATLRVQGDNFRASNLTIENTAGKVGQAIALSVEADRAVFTNCRVLGNQDTLYTAGTNARQLYRNCYIEGTTDFIFGEATAFFESCTIHSKSDSYITAASTPAGRTYGLVFYRCQLTAAPEVTSVYLGRPWRDFARTVFVECEMGGHIQPTGWHNWNSPAKEETVFYAEYGNTGPGAATSARVPWSRQLSERAAKEYHIDKVLHAFTLPPMTH